MESIYINRAAVARYLVTKKVNSSKAQELLAAFIMSGVLERATGHKTLVGFEIQDRFLREIPNGDGIPTHDLNALLDRVTADRDIDFAMKDNVDGKTWAFQIKHFGLGTHHTNTQALCDLIVSKAKHYGNIKNNLIMIILIESNAEIDFGLIGNVIDSMDGTIGFGQIVLMRGYNFDPAQEKITDRDAIIMSQVYPSIDEYEFNMLELLNPTENDIPKPV